MVRLMGEEQGVTVNQTKAAGFVDNWYGRKIFELANVRKEKEVLAEAEAIGKMLEKDPAEFKDEYISCTDRALKEAGLSS
jgi:hypothetical protein